MWWANMPSYNVHEAKSNFSKLIKQAEHGEEVIVMRDGEPVREARPIHTGAASKAAARLGRS